MRAALLWLALIGLAASVAEIQRRGPAKKYPTFQSTNNFQLFSEIWVGGLGHWKGNHYDPPPGGGTPWKASHWPGSVNDIPTRRQKNRAQPGTPGEPRGPRKKPGRTYQRCGRKRDICIPTTGLEMDRLAKAGLEAEFKTFTRNLYQLKAPRALDGKSMSRTDLRMRLTKLTQSKLGIKLRKFGGTSAAAKSIAAASIGVWIADMAEVFSSQESSTTDRIAAATSIVPGVGCVTRSMQMAQWNLEDVAADIFCGFGDLLEHTPLFPVGMATKTVSGLIYGNKQVDYWTAVHKRDDAWDSHYKNMFLPAIKSKIYQDKIQDLLSATVATQIYALADQAGRMYAAGVAAVENSNSVEELNLALGSTKDGWAKAWKTSCGEIKSLRAHACQEVSTNVTGWLRSQRKTYYRTFVVKLASSGLVDRRSEQGREVIRKLKQTRDTGDAREQYENVANAAYDACSRVLPSDKGLCRGRSDPPPLPAPFNLEDKMNELGLGETDANPEEIQVQVCGKDNLQGKCYKIDTLHGLCVKMPDDYRDSMASVELKTEGAHCTFHRDDDCGAFTPQPNLVQYPGMKHVEKNHFKSIACYYETMPMLSTLTMWPQNGLQGQPREVEITTGKCITLDKPATMASMRKSSITGPCSLYQSPTCEGQHMDVDRKKGPQARGGSASMPINSIKCDGWNFLEKNLEYSRRED